MVTRLTLRNPFHVGRAAMHGPPGNWYRLKAGAYIGSDGVRFVAGSQIEPRAADVDIVRLDPVAQHPPRFPIQITRYLEPAGYLTEPGNQDQGDGTVFSPGYRRDLAPPQESGIRPDPIAVEPPGDPRAQGEGIPIVDEHHGFPEHLAGRTPLNEELEGQQQAEHHPQPQAEAVKTRLGVLPD